MKKVILGFTATLALVACNQQVQQPLARGPVANPQLAAASASNSDHHPNFLRKLQNPRAYQFQFDNNTRSICNGKDTMLPVNEYDGSLGPSKKFVADRKGAVAALAMGSPGSTRKFCTGTMISEDLFLTASHCIDSSITSKFAVFNYEKAPGSSQLLPEDARKILAVVEDGEASGGRLDYAILQIDGKPGLKYGFTPIEVVLPTNGDPLAIIQHPRGNPKRVEGGPKVEGRGVYMGYEDLDTEPGSSGSGVLNAAGNLVGVHTNGGCYSSGGSNKGVKMTEIAKVSPTVQRLNIAARRR